MLGICTRLKNLMLEIGAYEYTHPGGNWSILEHCARSLPACDAGDVPGRGAVGCGVGCLCQPGRGAVVPLCLQSVCRFFVVPLWQERQLSVWLWRSIAVCLSVVAFTFLPLGNSTPRFCSSHSSARGFLIWYYVSSIAAEENPSMAIVAGFSKRCMSDCSSCTWPPCLAIVADMLKTYKKFVASKNEILLLRQGDSPP